MTKTSSGSGGIPTCTIASVASVPESLRDADRNHVWHPFTQQQGWSSEDAPIIERAEGTDLIDVDGRRYIDGVSSLWCTVHGHRHPHIDAAVREQLDRVAHSTMLGLTHPPAIRLAERLVGIAPPGLTRVFYSDSGSTAAEIALKMAFQYWQQQGGEAARRTRFVSLRNAYHGDTVGSVSVGGIDLFHSMYRPLLFDTLKAGPGDADELDFVLSGYPGEVAAVIVEPLVQGAAGMIMQPDGYLAAVRELCDRHGTLLICDEVATGFGRTGRMFACEHDGVTPDFLCLAKGLTGGYMPLAATLTTDRIYDGFLGEFHDFRTFFHGHTYTGNPLACAAALATLEVFERERTLERLQPKIALLERLLEGVAALPRVREVRQRGFMVGIELADFPLDARMGHRVALEARARGAIVRPLGDVVVLMPPLSITEQDLARLVAITAESIAGATGAAALSQAA
jgi:adenosylmethionine-8-amino-7-oxononanoate aminotransferase